MLLMFVLNCIIFFFFLQKYIYICTTNNAQYKKFNRAIKFIHKENPYKIFDAFIYIKKIKINNNTLVHSCNIIYQ